jgi:hypothetical protein
MSFRNQQDHLQAKNEVLEQQLREAEERANGLTKKRERELKRERRIWWSQKLTGVVWWTKVISVTLVALAIIGVVGFWWHFHSIAEERKAIGSHQQSLAVLRSHVPPGVDESEWVRCIDHCARFGVKSAHNGLISEGIVSDTFLDYGDDPSDPFPFASAPTESPSNSVFLISVIGPWLDRFGRNHKSYSVKSEDTDPPGTHIRVGDTIQIIVVRINETDTTTFRVLRTQGLSNGSMD